MSQTLFWQVPNQEIKNVLFVVFITFPLEKVVDLSELRLVFCCSASRSKREIAAMVGRDEGRASLVWGGSTVSFLASWAALFAEQRGRTALFAERGALVIVRGLTDPDVLAAALLPLLTESGEYRAGNEALVSS